MFIQGKIFVAAPSVLSQMEVFIIPKRNETTQVSRQESSDKLLLYLYAKIFPAS